MTEPLDPSRLRPKRPEELTERDLAFEALMQECEAEANRIANSTDENDRLRLLVIAGKVAQRHPVFAKRLLDSAEGAIHGHGEMRDALLPKQSD